VRALALVGGFVAAALVMGLPALRARAKIAVGIVAVLVGLVGPASYAFATVASPHGGAIPSAGPAVAGRFGFGGGRRAGNFPPPGNFTPPANGNGLPQFPGGQNPFPGGGQFPGGGGGARGGIGGLLDSRKPSSTLTALLEKNSGSYTWVAAAVGANNAAGYQLATNDPVMAIGGFNGTDPSPTLAQFQQYVRDGKIHYFIAGGGFGGGGGGFGGNASGSGTAITSWVTSNYKATTVGGVTLYDLTPSTAATT
jgi:4-amino-4-deoxy-L-arabinose transferase-like glycosyltransferase